MTGKPPVVRLSNDIASQFEHKPHDIAVAAIAKHINLFWDPRMRRELVDISDLHRGDLHEIVLDVIPAINVPAKAT